TSMSDADRETKLARAKGYPYHAPAYSYLFVNGKDYELDGSEGDPVLDGDIFVDDERLAATKFLRRIGIHNPVGLQKRTPVIAHGSNASPKQLARKFNSLDDDVIIPVLRGGLADFDVVYAAHFTAYGAIPATLAASPGTTAEIAIIYLTDAQLARMHRSEGLGASYVYGRLGRIFIDIDGLDPLSEAFVYITLRGAAMLSGKPVALSSITAHRRRFRAQPMPAMLALARDHLAPGLGLDDFILELIDDEPLRAERTVTLQQGAQRPQFPDFDVLVG
ncbi:MAG: hypothetical protein IIB67_10805, partial [Proteobacteria bacterium]|nr:hypothetical protein [Pseudomonadota bacterium]